MQTNRCGKYSAVALDVSEIRSCWPQCTPAWSTTSILVYSWVQNCFTWGMVPGFVARCCKSKSFSNIIYFRARICRPVYRTWNHVAANAGYHIQPRQIGLAPTKASSARPTLDSNTSKTLPIVLGARYLMVSDVWRGFPPWNMGCFSPIVFRFFVKGKNRSTTQFERCCVGYPPDPWALKEKIQRETWFPLHFPLNHITWANPSMRDTRVCLKMGCILKSGDETLNIPTFLIGHKME